MATRSKILKGKFPSTSKIEKPDWLTHSASAEWDRVVPKLVELGYASELDVMALSAYCELATEFYLSPTDFPSNKMTQLRLLMGDFGMTPQGRAKLPDRSDSKKDSVYAGM